MFLIYSFRKVPMMLGVTISAVSRRSLPYGLTATSLQSLPSSFAHAMTAGFKMTQLGLSFAQLSMIGSMMSKCAIALALILYSLVTESRQIFEVAQLTYRTIISLPVSIQRILETLRMSRSIIYVACFL
jgi:hypothetical protein